MEKKNIDWGNIGFAYMPTDMRYVRKFQRWKMGRGRSDRRLQCGY